MTRLPPPVAAALERWEARGIVSPELAARLRAEAEAHEAGTGRRGFQYVLAATGAVIVVIAAGVLADWIWPRLEAAGRSFTMAAVGFAVHVLGLQLESHARWRPAGYLLQTAGMLVVLGAFLYSEGAWADLSAPAVSIGIAGLVLPMLLTVRAVGRDPFMPAVHVALAFAFLGVFLDRATPLDEDRIVWTLDAVLVLVAVGLVLRLRRATDAPRDAWVLNAFVAALYAALVLVVCTALGPLAATTGTVWGLDAWLGVVVALTLWGLHGAPPALQRTWFGQQLALCVFYAIPLAFYTALEALDLGPEDAALAVGGIGGLAMSYGLARGDRAVLVAACLAVLSAAWYYGIDRGGALGAVGALAATAALLFWLSARLGRRTRAEEAA